MGELPGLLLAAVLMLTSAVTEGSRPASPVWSPFTPAADAIRAEIRAHGHVPDSAASLLSRWPEADPYRRLLFHGDRATARIAAGCLVRLRDRHTVVRLLHLAEAGGLGAGDYPAALFGWVVGASYDARLLPRIRSLLGSQDTHTRIFALEAARTLTFLGSRMPAAEPRFANPGEVWFMRRWCYRNSAPTTDPWLAHQVRAVVARIQDPDEAREAERFFARFRRK